MKRTATIIGLSCTLVLGAAGQRRETSPAPESAAYPIMPKTESEKRIISTISEAVSVTTALSLYDAEHVAPHVIAAGALVTVPVPVPFLVIVRGKLCSVKVAVTAVAAVMVTVQASVPVHPPPLQPVKVESGAGVADNVTRVP